jgi:hypothetical protein
MAMRRATGHNSPSQLEAAVQLLPTPEASDATGGRVSSEMGGQRPSGSKRAVTLGTATAHLLKTPTAQLAVNGGSQHPDKRKAGGHGPTLADEVEHLLPTPRATDGTKGGPNQRGSSGDLMLPSAVMTLLPTPRCADGMIASNMQSNRDRLERGSRRRGTLEEEISLQPTPTAVDFKGPNPLERDRDGKPRPVSDDDLPTAMARLLPTPTVADSRNSRNATAGRTPGSAHHAGTTLSDAFWSGDPTGQPSPAGKPSPAAPLPGQLSLDEQVSDSHPDLSSG